MSSTPLPTPGPTLLAASSRSQARGSSFAPLQPQFWADGRPLLPGFALDPDPLTDDKWFAPPDVPKDWRPRPARVWDRGKKWDLKPADVAKEKLLASAPSGREETGEEAWKRRQAMTTEKVRSATSPPPLHTPIDLTPISYSSSARCRLGRTLPAPITPTAAACGFRPPLRPP